MEAWQFSDSESDRHRARGTLELHRFFGHRRQIMASFEELKSKYQSVLQLVQDKKVQMMNLHLQDGKLFMKGHAPTQDAANAVWNELKRVNPKLDDVIAEFPVEANQPKNPEQ